VRSHGASEVLRLDDPEFDALVASCPAFAQATLRYLARQTRGLYQAIDLTERSFDDFFLSPNARICPGPYFTAPFEMVVFLMRDAPERLRALLPPSSRRRCRISKSARSMRMAATNSFRMTACAAPLRSD